MYKGYGEYDTLYLSNSSDEYSIITASQFIVFNKTSFVTLKLLCDDNKQNYSPIYYCVILNNGKNKLRYYTSYKDSYFLRWHENTMLLKQYNNKAAENNGGVTTYNIYSEDGDSLATLYDYLYSSLLEAGNDFINIREAIHFVYDKTYFIVEKLDYSKESSNVNRQIWNNQIKYKFDISANTRILYKIKKNDNLWDYTIHFLYYDGTKKETSFRVDINSGKIKEL